MNRSFVFPSRAPSPAVVVSIPRDSFFAGGDSSQGHGKASFSSEMYELTEEEKQVSPHAGEEEEGAGADVVPWS
jgi:hypothetical protein